MYSEKVVRRLQVALASGDMSKLNEDESRIWDMLQYADVQIRRHGYSKARVMVSNRFGIPKSSAHKVCTTTGIVHGSDDAINKPYIKSIVVDSLLKTLGFLVDQLEMYPEKEDFADEDEKVIYEAKMRDHHNEILKSNIGRQISQVTDQLRKATKFDEELGEGELWKDFQQHIISFTGDPSVIGMKKMDDLEVQKEQLMEKLMNAEDIEDAKFID